MEQPHSYDHPADALVDVVVVGSGAAGLSAALTARLMGLETLVVEKDACIGGTTALSGGWLWAPCNPLAVRAGVSDSLTEARRLVEFAAGRNFDARRVDAFLENAPTMVAFFEQRAGLQFMLGTTVPDYLPDAPGGKAGGRALCAPPFDGRRLGSWIKRLRPPLADQTVLGMRVAGNATELMHFFNATRSWTSAKFVGRRMAAYLVDRLRDGQDMRLLNGNALVAMMLRSALDLGVRFWLSSAVTALIREQQRVSGVRIEHSGKRIEVRARRGVILAAGGFPHDLRRCRELYPHAPAAGEHFSVAPAGNTGDGIRMAEQVGAEVLTFGDGSAAWYPVSRVRDRRGVARTFAHSVDRGKPGIIAVDGSGRRFGNESSSYFHLVQALLRAHAGSSGPVRAFLVADHRAIQRYGLGAAKPFPFPKRHLLRSGYLTRADSLRELAEKLGLDAEALVVTIAEFNSNAKRGVDPQFHSGENAFNRFMGDPGHAPNPCIAALEKPPYYAVRIQPGDLGTFSGLKTDEHARVLDGDARVIQGLYAAGNDMASVLGGNYPGAGITLGPAMTFGYIAARHLAGTVEPAMEAAPSLRKAATLS